VNLEALELDTTTELQGYTIFVWVRVLWRLWYLCDLSSHQVLLCWSLTLFRPSFGIRATFYVSWRIFLI